jgi:SOS-response transcriptional repressor LexA
MAKAKQKTNEFLVALRKRVAGPRGMKRFASLCGIPYTTYRNYELGRNRVPFTAAKAIASATGEDPYFIMAGKETAEKAPLKLPPPPREHVLHARGSVSLESFRKDKNLKDRIPVHVTAEEYGKGDDFLKGGNRFAVFARGNSMAPTILPGDLLVFASRGRPSNGDVVLVSKDKEMQVKRYVRDARRKLIVLQPENGRFPALVLREGKPEARKFKVEGVLLSLRRSRFK